MNYLRTLVLSLFLTSFPFSVLAIEPQELLLQWQNKSFYITDTYKNGSANLARVDINGEETLTNIWVKNGEIKRVGITRILKSEYNLFYFHTYQGKEYLKTLIPLEMIEEFENCRLTQFNNTGSSYCESRNYIFEFSIINTIKAHRLDIRVK